MNKIYKFGDPCGMRREIFMWEKASIKISNTDTFSKKTMLMGKILEGMKEMRIMEGAVSLKSSVKESQRRSLEALADAIADEIQH